MPWSLIFNWRVVLAILIALTLASTHWKAYVFGKNTVIQQVQIEAAANEKTARAQEHALVEAKQKAEQAYESQKITHRRAVAGAQSELGRLRDALAARSAAPTAPTSAGVDAAAPIERELFGQCAETLTGMAQQAGQLAAQVSGLQGYVTAVCHQAQ